MISFSSLVSHCNNVSYSLLRVYVVGGENTSVESQDLMLDLDVMERRPFGG